MSLSLKEGVRVHGLVPEMVLAVFVIDGVLREAGIDTVITSASEGSHSNASLHYAGCAVDIRTNTVPTDKQEPLRVEIAKRLGGDYDAVLEVDHWHVEWQPKKAYG